MEENKRDAVQEDSAGAPGSGIPGSPHTIDLASMASRVAALSHGLSLALSPLSAHPGQVVMLAATNSSAMLEALLAICDTGAIATPINHRWGPAELAAAMQLTQPIAIIVDTACTSLVQQAMHLLRGAHSDLGEHVPHVPGVDPCGGPAQHHQRVQAAQVQPRVILLGAGADVGSVHVLPGDAGQRQTPRHCCSHNSCPSDAQLSTEGLILAGRCTLAGSRGVRKVEADLQQAGVCGGGATEAAADGGGQHKRCLPLQLKVPADGAAIICFTSGTTGRPKGVVLTHASLHAQSLAKLATINYTAADKYLHLAPLFHVGGLSSAHAALMAGCAQVVLPRFDAASAMQVMQSQRVTAFIAVPAMMQDLTTHARSCTPSTNSAAFKSDSADIRPVPSVRKILMGAGATSPKLLADMAKLFPCARIMSAYGMTETASSITFITLRQPHCSNSDHPHSPNAPNTPPHWAPPMLPLSSHSGRIHSPTAPPTPPHWPPMQPHCINASNTHNPTAPLTPPHWPPVQPHSSNAGHISSLSTPLAPPHLPPLQPHNSNSGTMHSPTAPHLSPHRPPTQPPSSHSGHIKSPDAPPIQPTCSDCTHPGSPRQHSSQPSHTHSRHSGTSHPAPGSGAVCVGWPGPGIKVHIHPQEGDPAAEGAAGEGGQEGVPTHGVGVLGEVCVQGACVMAGYWQAPEDTEKTLLRGRQGIWLRTGDLGFLDSGGALWLHGRAKDMIKSGGENVHAAEVEAALAQHPGIAAAAVFGVPDARMGEVVAAAVALQPGWDWRGLLLGQLATHPLQGQGLECAAHWQDQRDGPRQRALTADQLRAFCRTGVLHGDGKMPEDARQGLLSPYKLPRLIAATWPLGSPLSCNSSGKVLKLQVREAMLTTLGAEAQQERDGLRAIRIHGTRSRL